MISVKESIGTSDSLLGTMIIVDTLVGYGWMAVVISFSGFQKKIDKKNKVDLSLTHQINKKLEFSSETSEKEKYLESTAIVNIKKGDEVKLIGVADKGESARIDFIEFIKNFYFYFK